MDLADLSIFPANPDQLRVHRERTWEQWGRGMSSQSREEFLKRDLIYADVPHSVNGKFAVWILSPRQNAAENKDFLASCETFQRECVVSTSVRGDLEGPTTSYAITAVLTPPHHRGKGYAKHMMRLLHYVLAGHTGTTTLPAFPTEKWGEPPRIPSGFRKGIASALYSIIGSEFYKSCGKGLGTDNGWVTRQPIRTIWTVPQDGGDAHDVLRSSMEWITKEEQHVVMEEDAHLIREEISISSTPSFAFLPDQGVATYQQNRSEFLCPEKSNRGVWGAKLLDRSNQTDERGRAMGHRRLSFATWALDPGSEGPQTLLITRLRCTQEEFPTLLNAAFQAARMFDLEKVEIWNLDASLKQIGEGVLGGIMVERNSYLPSLAWYGEVDEASVVWRYNEKFCWC